MQKLLKRRLLSSTGDFCYCLNMVWDYDDEEYKKQAQADPGWKLERLINYGLNGEKLNRKELEQYLPQLKIPDNRRAFLELLLWNKPF